MTSEEEPRVVKRNGEYEDVSFDKILKRVKKLTLEAKLTINCVPLVMKVIEQLHDGIETQMIDKLTAEECIASVTKHPDYGKLASRILVSNHQKKTSNNFAEVMNILYNNKDIHDKHSPLLARTVWEFIIMNGDELNSYCDYDRDYNIDYFGFKTLERSYLMKINNNPVERIQHMWLRVAIGIHNGDLIKIKETYDYMSQGYFTHATPTLNNTGTPRPQLSSCYLLAMETIVLMVYIIH